MKKLLGLFLLLVLLGVVGTAQAITMGSVYNNEIFYNNYEAVFRDADENGTTDGVYNEIVYLRGENDSPVPQLQVGDIFVGILSVGNIKHGGSAIWSQTIGSDEITGIFAQEIININPAFGGTGGLDVQIDLDVASTNTFIASNGDILNLGLDLANGEMIRFFHDQGPGATQFDSGNNKTLLQSFNTAADGDRWLSVGIDTGEGTTGPDGSGNVNQGADYAYSNVTPQGTDLEGFDGQSFMGLSITWASSDFTGWVDDGINDTGEERYDSDVDYYANSELLANPGYTTEGGAYSPWTFQSNDPATVGPVPEPGTFILFGTALLGFSAMLRRKKIS